MVNQITSYLCASIPRQNMRKASCAWSGTLYGWWQISHLFLGCISLHLSRHSGWTYRMEPVQPQGETDLQGS